MAASRHFSSAATSSSKAVAAPSAEVCYHISDHLIDRHKYGSGSAGDAKFVRTVQHSPVVDHFQHNGIDELLDHLKNDSLDAVPRAKALRILLSRSMPVEAKIEMVKAGIVPVVARVLSEGPTKMKGGLLPQGEAFAGQILRSLSVVPAGAYSVIADGGLAALVKRIADRNNAPERAAARSAALSAVQLLCSSWNTREWLLGIVGEDEQMRVTPAREGDQAARDELASATCRALVGVVGQESGSMQLLVPATEALALLTTSPAGQGAALAAGAMEACISVTGKLAETGINGAEEQQAGTSACTALWNMCMNAAGKVKCCDAVESGTDKKSAAAAAVASSKKAGAAGLPLVRSLGFLLSVVLSTPKPGQHLRLKAALAGALGAAAIHVPAKPQLLEPLTGAMALPASRAADCVMHGQATTLGRLVVLLQECSAEYGPLFELRKANALPPGEKTSRFDEVSAAIKNTVHCIRIVAELPAARRELMPWLVPEGPEPAPMLASGMPLILRRQIFYETEWSKEFRVPPV